MGTAECANLVANRFGNCPNSHPNVRHAHANRNSSGNNDRANRHPQGDNDHANRHTSEPDTRPDRRRQLAQVCLCTLCGCYALNWL